MVGCYRLGTLPITTRSSSMVVFKNPLFSFCMFIIVGHRTDIHLEPSCSIHTFRLPPPTRIGKQQKHVTWVWTDPEWIRGQEGWQYTDWTWKFWSKTRTRRERWYRLAERKEYLVNL